MRALGHSPISTVVSGAACSDFGSAQTFSPDACGHPGCFKTIREGQ
jgi:hypothetical protein